MMISLPFVLTDRRCGSRDSGFRMSVWEVTNTKQCPKDIHRLTKRVFLIFCSLSQTKASIVLFYSPVHTVPESFIHVYSQIVSASDVEIDEEAFVDVVGNEFEQVHHFPCQAKSAVLGSDCDGSYVAVVLETITLGLSKD